MTSNDRHAGRTPGEIAAIVNYYNSPVYCIRSVLHPSYPVHQPKLAIDREKM